MEQAKVPLRLFTTFARQPKAAERPSCVKYAEGSDKSGLWYKISSILPLELTSLLLHTIINKDDKLAAALRDHLIPQWAWWRINPFLERQYKAFIESPCFGCQGLCNYLASRMQWLDSEVGAALAGGITQVVVLWGGYDTRPYRLRAPNARFFWVESRQVLEKNQAGLEAVLGRDKRLHAALGLGGTAGVLQQYIPVAVEPSNPANLIPALTAKGFNPEAKCIVVAEGLLYHLTETAMDSLLGDLSALCAPGSHLYFDLVHQDALSGQAQPQGFANLAVAVANKGRPFLSGVQPQFSGIVRLLSRHRFRPISFLPPSEIARAFLPGQHSGGESLPPLPLFFSLAAGVKADPVLLPRRALSEEGVQRASSCSQEEGAVAGLEIGCRGPTCWLDSVMGLLLGRGTTGPPRVAAAADSASRSRAERDTLLLPPTMPGGPLPISGYLASGIGVPLQPSLGSPPGYMGSRGSRAPLQPGSCQQSSDWKLKALVTPEGAASRGPRPADLLQPSTLLTSAAALAAAAAGAGAAGGGVALANCPSAAVPPSASSSAESL